MALGTVVEFVGLPGAGKSFLAEGLTERLAAGGLAATTISRPSIGYRQRAGLLASFAIRRPRFLLQTVRALWGTKEAFRLWTNWLT
ncbi:MAG: AAA family ATPase, partial [bacterium]|nr:AAA family ATPase [bacterium]